MLVVIYCREFIACIMLCVCFYFKLILSRFRIIVTHTDKAEDENNLSSQCTLYTRGGGYFLKNWVGVCDTLPETLTRFQTKICDFRYPISGLIKNLIPYFRPDP